MSEGAICDEELELLLRKLPCRIIYLSKFCLVCLQKDFSIHYSLTRLFSEAYCKNRVQFLFTEL